MKLACCLLPQKILRGESYQLLTRARGCIGRNLITFSPHNDAVRLFLPQLFSKHWRSLQPIPSSRFRTRTYSTPPATLIDPSRPSIFYHLLPPPNPISKHLPAYAVSLLERPPKDVHSAAVMGWLPAAVNDQSGVEDGAGLGDFKENPEFLIMLHRAIREAIEDGNDERLTSEAIQVGQGWMHVNDDRHLPEMGRISSPDDIIGSVRVEGGRILPETYNPMPTYRICTTDGLTTLSKGLEQKLLEALRRIECQ